MSAVEAPVVASEFADPKLWATIAGIAVSLIWNFYNTKRNWALDAATKRNTAAIRFEAVHGSAINSALEELRQCSMIIRNAMHTCKSVDEVAASLSKDLKSKLSEVQHSFALDFRPIADNRTLSCQPDDWRSIALFDWDEIITTYDAARNADNLGACSVKLMKLQEAVEDVRKRLLRLRVNENGSS